MSSCAVDGHVWDLAKDECCVCGISGMDFANSSFTLGPEPKTPALDERPRCPECKRELSETLDAYFGTSIWKRAFCEPCRRKIDRKYASEVKP